MKYRNLRCLRLSFWAMLLCLFLAACGSESSETRKQLKTKADLKGAVIGVQLGTTSDGLATELERKEMAPRWNGTTRVPMPSRLSCRER